MNSYSQRFILGTVALCLTIASAASAIGGDAKAAEKRAAIDAMEKETMADLFSKSPRAKELYDEAVAYAVFDNLKLSLIISAGGGVGIAIDKESGTRTYMKMGTVGLNIGLGGQKYQVIFLFENSKIFERFVEKGYKAEGSANAAAGKSGVNVETTFNAGIATYQITEKGLMLSVDISGTKYWKNNKLNK